MASSLYTSLTILLLVGSSFTRMVDESEVETNSLGDASAESKKLPSSKYDPSFFDVLASNYFDEEPLKEPVYFAPNAPVNDETESRVTEERGPCLGCALEVDPADHKIKEIASFAFDSYTNEKGSPHGVAHTFVKVVSAKTQVVSGQKYILDLELQAANCSMEEYETNPDNCLVDSERETIKCRFEVVERSWINSKEVVLSRCGEENQEEATTVGINVEEPEVQLNAETFEASASDEIIVPNEDTTPIESLKSRRKRDVKLGEKRDAQEDSKTLEEFGEYAVKQLDVIDADNDARILLDVLSAKKQVFYCSLK